MPLPSRRPLTRRALLRGLGAGLVAPTLLPLLPSRAEAAGGFPQRLLVFTHGQGTLTDSLVTPGSTERDWGLGPILAPLARHKQRLLVVRGVDDATNALDSPYNGHTRCRLHTLTARGMHWSPSGDGVVPTSAGGPSIDQWLAQRWAGRTAFPSLEHGVSVGTEAGNTYTWRDVGLPALPENDPGVAFDRIFADLLEPDPAAAAALQTRRERILDTVQRQLDHLTPRLDRDDRDVLDVHRAALDDLRHSLATVALGAACEAPSIDRLDSSAPGEAQAHAQLLAMALGCDLTRVGSLAFGGLDAFPWLDVDFPTGWHDAVHAGPTTPEARADLETSYAWFAEQLALLLDALDAVPEGDGTLLDHTLVLYANVFSDGSTHDHTDKTYVLAGGAPGLELDRLVDADGAAHGDLLTAVLHAVGEPEATFGDPLFCSGPLAGVLS